MNVMDDIKRRHFVMSLAVAGQRRTQAEGQSGTADLFRPIRDLLSGNAHLTWVFSGDSITHGALHTMGAAAIRNISQNVSGGSFSADRMSSSIRVSAATG